MLSVEGGEVGAWGGFGGGEDVDFDDLPAGDRQAHDRDRPPLGSRDESGCAVHERGMRVPGQPGEPERAFGHVPRTPDEPRGAVGHRASVGAEHDIGVEERDERPTMGAMSSNGTPNMSCSTNANRSAGASVSSTTSSASPTESAISASCSGSTPSPPLTTGSGRRPPSGSSR